MHKLVAATGAVLVAGLTVIGLSITPAAAAPAQVQNPGCGAALLALTQAEKAAQDATAADTAAADAKKADDALANAQDAVNAARAAAVNAGVASEALTALDLQTLKAERTTITTKPADQRTDVEIARLGVLDKQIPLIEAFLTAQINLTAATAAAGSDADALRREADKTDAAALIDAAGRAGDAADKACGAGNGVRFENCDQVRAAGKAPLRSDQPGYRVGLDRNRNGIACENVENTVTPTPSAVPVPSSINTGLAA